MPARAMVAVTRQAWITDTRAPARAAAWATSTSDGHAASSCSGSRPCKSSTKLSCATCTRDAPDSLGGRAGRRGLLRDLKERRLHADPAILRPESAANREVHGLLEVGKQPHSEQPRGDEGQ